METRRPIRYCIDVQLSHMTIIIESTKRRGDMSSHIFWFLVQAQVHEFLEESTEVPGKLRGVCLWDLEENPHWVELGVGRFALRKLYGRYAKAPDVGLKWLQNKEFENSFLRIFSIIC